MSWRVAHNDAVEALVGGWTGGVDTAEIVERLSAAGVVASPVHTIDDLLEWPHLQARRMIQAVEHPTLGVLDGLRAAGFPLKFSAGETGRSEEHTSELQSLMRISYAVFCLKKKTHTRKTPTRQLPTKHRSY